MRVHIDAKVCEGHGRCYVLSPLVFAADEEGNGEVLVGSSTRRTDRGRGPCVEELSGRCDHGLGRRIALRSGDTPQLDASRSCSPYSTVTFRLWKALRVDALASNEKIYLPTHSFDAWRLAMHIERGRFMSEVELEYKILDADNHFNEPLDCYERYIDPKLQHLAIRHVDGPDGKPIQLFAGRPSRFSTEQVIYSDDELQKMLGSNPTHEIEPTAAPGIFLNRMNSMRGLSDEEKSELLATFRDQRSRTGTAICGWP